MEISQNIWRKKKESTFPLSAWQQKQHFFIGQFTQAISTWLRQGKSKKTRKEISTTYPDKCLGRRRRRERRTRKEVYQLKKSSKTSSSLTTSYSIRGHLFLSLPPPTSLPFLPFPNKNCKKPARLLEGKWRFAKIIIIIITQWLYFSKKPMLCLKKSQPPPPSIKKSGTRKWITLLFLWHGTSYNSFLLSLSYHPMTFLALPKKHTKLRKNKPYIFQFLPTILSNVT